MGSLQKNDVHNQPVGRRRPEKTGLAGQPGDPLGVNMGLFDIFKKPKPNTLSLEEIERQTESLNAIAGTWPVKFDSEVQQNEIFQYWQSLLRQAQRCYETMLDEEERTLVVLADLYRQGHNMEIENCAQNASQSISICLSKYPNSIRGNMVGAYFYLSVNPAAAPRGEACLQKLRELVGEGVNRDIERGFVFAYLAQNNLEEALKQTKYVIEKFGTDDTINAIKIGIETGMLTTIIK